ncbi:hypothetical protein BPOR_0077g00050 [Botrytis porri]|uniref:Uncharacterized protein n=1 Tax=Botrytis porri TaxID=87229 RepID=A0A4Z1L004_9HELO|nr:hypothetical protein BPOR_0077g00050 [Botrytis porri]
MSELPRTKLSENRHLIAIGPVTSPVVMLMQTRELNPTGQRLCWYRE